MGINFDLFSLIPALGAILISIKNWLDLRQGPAITPMGFVNYALWGIKYQEKMNKALILPIILDNNGFHTGMVTEVKIYLSGTTGTRELPIRRRIELKSTNVEQLKSFTIDDYRAKGMTEINPFYPIFVNAREGVSFLVEAFDGSGIINLNEEMTCKLEIHYNQRVSYTEFPFTITSEQFEKSRDHLLWFRP